MFELLLADNEREVQWTMAERAPHLVDVATAERMDREFSPADTNYAPWRPADVLTFPPRCCAASPPTPTRGCGAWHRALSGQALIALLDDPDERTVHAAASSPWLPVHEMERLLRLAEL